MELQVVISEVGSSFELKKDLLEEAKKEINTLLGTEVDINFKTKEAAEYEFFQNLGRSCPTYPTKVDVTLAGKVKDQLSTKKSLVSVIVKLVMNSNTADDLYCLTERKHPLILSSVIFNKNKPQDFLNFSPLPKTPKN